VGCRGEESNHPPLRVASDAQRSPQSYPGVCPPLPKQGERAHNGLHNAPPYRLKADGYGLVIEGVFADQTVDDATRSRLVGELCDLRRARRQDNGIGAYWNEGVGTLSSGMRDDCCKEPELQLRADDHVMGQGAIICNGVRLNC
jgi:hypothetical protein